METKICSKCSVEKLLLEFNVCSRVKDGRKAECRECQKIGSKKYKSENKDKIKEYNQLHNTSYGYSCSSLLALVNENNKYKIVTKLENC